MRPYGGRLPTRQLDVLVWELVGTVRAHDELCVKCRSLPPGFGCAASTDAIEAVLDWRRGRILRSRAAAVRRSELRDELARIRCELETRVAA